MQIEPKRITKNEKTDFIVNMTRPQFMRMDFVFLILACVGAIFSCVGYCLTRGNEYLSGDFTASTMANSLSMKAFESLRYSAVIIMAVGFLGYLLFFIAGVKNYFKLKENMGILLCVGYLFMCGVSTVLAEDKSLAFFGNDGRYEGLIAIIAYVGFFLVASQLCDKRLKEKLLYVICVLISIHAVVGIFQGFEITSEIFPSFFVENYTIYGSQVTHFVATGFTSSPFALASLCVMGFAVCLGGVMYSEKNIGIAIFSVCGLCVTMGGLLTKNVAVLAGFVVVILCLGIIEVARLRTKHCLWVKGFFKNALGRFILATVVVVGIFVGLIYTGNFQLYDEYIIRQDAIRVLCPLSAEFMNRGLYIYTDIWKNVLKVIKDNFVFGVGFEGLVGSDLSRLGNPDRAYNELLNITAATGVVSLIFYVGFVVRCAIKGAKGVEKFFNREDNFVKAVAFSACAGYIATSMFGNTDFVATPIFFTFMGLAVAKSDNQRD